MKLYIINPARGKAKRQGSLKVGRKPKSKKGGPMAKRRKRRKAKKVMRRRTYRKNPAKRRRYRRNPAGRGILKSAFNKKHMVNILSLGVGFVGGIKAQKYINDMEFMANFRRFSGLIPFVLGTMLGIRGKGEAVKSVGAGLSLSGLYDLVTQNVPQIGLSPVEGVDLEDNTYGTALDIDGTAIDVEGDDTVLVGDDDLEMVGESDGSPYAMV